MTNQHIEKPPYGSPCNGCGQCCEEDICPLGQGLFGQTVGPCPALGRDADGKSSCGLVTHPRRWAPVKANIHGVAAMRQAALDLNGCGAGCDSYAVDAPFDFNKEAQDRMLAIADAIPNDRIKKAMRVWGLLPL